MGKEENYIFGRNPVLEAIASGKSIEKIYVCFGTSGDSVNTLFSKAKKAGIKCSNLDKRKFGELERNELPKGAKTQGVIAIIRSFETVTLEEMVETAFQNNKRPVIIALDGITDPHNLGAIARSAECSGAAGIIIPEHNSAPITAIAVKASAGALSHLPVAKVNNLSQALINLKENGFWIIGSSSESDRLYTENIYNQPTVLLIGSEGKGLRPGIINQCDFMVKIPLYGKVSSLNASVTSGIILFEIMRQRNFQYE
ncbi:MAG: 23S rRNA (guanosine(2251)-2'-O)-methyltransferase RlmB [Ignavibacteriae bacterium]|nr:23S rRNA (guanosine(2251)-2'-O)-methyltransferase RlmB [Ignavibacteriota bacterium]